MHVLPIDQSDALQINPLNGIILAHDMEGWFMERYINIFMNGTIVDYVDNVNYAGIIDSGRCYSYDDIKAEGIIDILVKELNENHFLIVWVDEIFIPSSIRYQQNNFVHPMLVYGYDEDKQVVKSVFFDILRGNVLVDMHYQSIVEATSCLDQYYLYGGTECAITATVASYCMSKHVKGTFHFDVLVRELRNYLCCQTDHLTEWYTLSRPGVFDSDHNIFGIQIYLQLAKLLRAEKSAIEVEYKALHDFVKHKKYLLDRLLYVQKNYETSVAYDDLVEKFSDNYRLLERIRILNLKEQVKAGLFLASLCCEPTYISSLIDRLEECYQVEMEILPRIYEELVKLTYSKQNIAQHAIIALTPGAHIDDEDDIKLGSIAFNIPDSGIYTTQIDVVRTGKCFDRTGFEYVIINDEVKYFLEKDSSDHIPVRSLKMPATKLKALRLYTDTESCHYTVNVYSLVNHSSSDNIVLEMNGQWNGYHHVSRLEQVATDEMMLVVTGEDPFIIREKIGVDADSYPYIHIRMSTTVQTIYAQIYFATLDNPAISQERSLFFQTIPDGEYHSYYVHMSEHAQWQGLIETIRFDPAQFSKTYPWNKSNSSICQISHFELLKSKPNGAVACVVMSDLQEENDINPDSKRWHVAILKIVLENCSRYIGRLFVYAGHPPCRGNSPCK